MRTYKCDCGWLVHSAVTKTIKCPKCGNLIECQGTPKPIGLGDLLETVFNYLGGKQFKKVYHWLFKKDCGCGKRKDWLNRYRFLARPAPTIHKK